MNTEQPRPHLMTKTEKAESKRRIAKAMESMRRTALGLESDQGELDARIQEMECASPISMRTA